MRRVARDRTDFYVYVYFRPWNGQPCYIGKGLGRRRQMHEFQGINHSNKHFANIFKKAGGNLPSVVIREGLSNEEASELEILFISIIGRADKKLGPLVNHTDGGDGVPGLVHTDRTKGILSVRGKGRKLTEQHRAKLREANLGRTASESTRRLLAEANLGKKRSPKARANMSASRKHWYEVGGTPPLAR